MLGLRKFWTNCPKKTNQYPLSWSSVPSSNVTAVYMSGVNTNPVSTELVAAPREITFSKGYAEDMPTLRTLLTSKEMVLMMLVPLTFKLVLIVQI